jgi:hypothetical protein
MFHSIVWTVITFRQCLFAFAGWQIAALALVLAVASGAAAQESGTQLQVSWRQNKLYIRGAEIPGGVVEVWYLEAYCRANSHTTDWDNTVVEHRTELLEAKDGTQLHLRCRVADGLVVDHVITAGQDDIDFQITAHNPTQSRSEVHWAQPCVRVGRFTGGGPEEKDDPYAYIKKSFVFLNGKLQFMPTPGWTTEARYTPGQVWAAPGVPASDVNPRPLNQFRPTNGLIGCVSGDGQKILAIAFDPYQELFQGVIRCLHSDFRLGGLQPGETKKIHGKIYIVDNDPAALVARYAKDFPSNGAP